MKLVVLFIIMTFQITIFGKIYKYRDSRGGIHYVDDINKIPDSKLRKASIVTKKFYKTKIKELDNIRKIIKNKGIYYKKIDQQKKYLMEWLTIIVRTGKSSFKIYMEQIAAIDTTTKSRKEKIIAARRLANYYKIIEAEWPEIYKNINFKSTNIPELDKWRRDLKDKTTSFNLENRITLLEKWHQILKKSKITNKPIINKHMKKIDNMFDVPQPDISTLIKYVDKTAKVFEKEFVK